VAIRLYDLVGQDDRRFSSNAWKTRLALAHKGLDTETVPTPFTAIPKIGDGSYATVPVIDDRGTWAGDSWAIAEYLEDTYPEAPSLFGGPAGRDHARFVQRWAESRIHPLMMTLVLADIRERIVAEDEAYFDDSRPKRFGKPVAEVQAGRETRLPEYRARLEPLRRVVAEQPFLGGAAPMYADYIVMGSIVGARNMSAFALFEAGDPVHGWVHRCLDLYDGLARRPTDFDW
jgi:glutathione S-transferase